MLLAGPISHTSTLYFDFVDFLHFSGSVYQLFCSFQWVLSFLCVQLSLYPRLLCHVFWSQVECKMVCLFLLSETLQKAFIKGELIHNVKNSSNLKAFEKMKVLFCTRLRHRGYPPKFLWPIFELVQYSRRNFYLVPKFKKYAAQEQNSLFSYHIQF